ncbi:MAG: histidine phosphatase family protein, partial [Mesorhizobium sp.]
MPARATLCGVRQKEQAARGVADRLKEQTFQAVWSSPSQRAFDTCRLAGFG